MVGSADGCGVGAYDCAVHSCARNTVRASAAEHVVDVTRRVNNVMPGRPAPVLLKLAPAVLTPDKVVRTSGYDAASGTWSRSSSRIAANCVPAHVRDGQEGVP